MKCPAPKKTMNYVSRTEDGSCVEIKGFIHFITFKPLKVFGGTGGEVTSCYFHSSRIQSTIKIRQENQEKKAKNEIYKSMKSLEKLTIAGASSGHIKML